MAFDSSRGPPQIEGMTSLKVDNLTYRTTVEDLNRVFKKFGDLGDVYIPRDRNSHESRGFAFIRFWESRDAEDAIDTLDRSILDGREIRVQKARYGRPTESYRPRRRGYGGGGGYSGGRYRSRSRSPRRRRSRYSRSRSRSPRRRRSSSPRRRSRSPSPVRRTRSRSGSRHRRSRSKSRSHTPCRCKSGSPSPRRQFNDESKYPNDA